MAENIKRRDFLKALTVASSGALAACSTSQPQKLIPYVVPPEGTIPGIATWYKSVCRECPAGCGTLVRTREGRVVKVEGNPEHPVNRGALCARGQAAVEGLYNPDRIAQPLRRNDDGRLEAITWEQAEEQLASVTRYLRHARRAGRMALVSERVTGSTQRLFRDWLAACGSQRFLIYEPFAYEALRAANRMTFGTPEIPHHDLSRAGMILSFGADFLETWVSNVEFTRQFAAMRRPQAGRAGRFVHAGPRLSLTAANADEWIPLRPGGEIYLALGLLREILAAGLARIPPGEAARLAPLVARFDPARVGQQTGVPAARVGKLAREFAAAAPGLALGSGVGASGASATALQVAVNLLNSVCGNVGETVEFGRGADWEAVATHRQMLDFVDGMRDDEVDVAIFCRVNPAYALPAAAGFARALDRVPFKISFSSVLDETAALCDLILPDAAPLERWEEFSPRAGVYGLAQPAMAPGFHFQSRQAEDVLLSVARKTDAELARRFPSANFRDYLREEWKALHRQFAPGKDFETFWREAVEAGGVWRDEPATSVRLNEAVLRFDFAAAAEAGFAAQTPISVRGRDLHLVVYPSAQFFDGRGAGRPWLQETPDAMTKIVWDSWAEVHPITAQKNGIGEGDLVKLTSAAGTIQLPAHLYDGARQDTVAIPLGQGHTSFGRWVDGTETSPMRLLPAATEEASGGLLWAGTSVRIERLAQNRPLARTQIETSQHEREIAQVVPLAALLAGGDKVKPATHPALSMYAPHKHPEHRWGMAIDLDACVGCNACVVACAVENNVPWVGKEQVARGRHMAWMRIDRYFEPAAHGSASGPETRFVPMLCQHCDAAPCESVCPVYATYHNPEGLNVQVYNRCVGTRYCSNNCPYKVRRFNWFDPDWPWPMQLGLNPDLSARSKGVMEKCSFCIQRIRGAKDTAKDEKRAVRDGEITPACAQTCPAGAILFGDLNDPKSRVSELAHSARAYNVLGELNTRPAITYLKKISRSGAEG